MPPCSRTIFGVLSIFLGVLHDVTPITHGRNLIWGQKEQGRNGTGIARIVGVSGDPNNWVVHRSATTRYITAPNNNWHFVALGFDYTDRTLFWSDRGNKKIQGLSLNGSTSAYTVFGGTSSEVEGIAVDWLAKNLYWTDALYNWIMVARTRPGGGATRFRILVDKGLDKPMGIAVHPQKGRLFWSDWGAYPKIETSDLAGENRKLLVHKDLRAPMGLAVDYSDDRLFWVDSLMHSIESTDLDGKNRQVFQVAKESNFFGISLYQDYIFATDQGSGQLRVYNKRTNNNDVNFKLGATPYGIIMYDESSQARSNASCSTKRCEHICVHSPSGSARCLCTNGFTLKDDGVSCEDDRKYGTPQYIYSIGSALCRFPGNLPDMSLQNISLDVQCFLTHRQAMLALGFNVHSQTLYFSENRTKTISRIRLVDGQTPKVVTGGVGQVEGIAVDWISDNLYWTDRAYGHVMVARGDGRFQQVLISGLDNPRGIAAEPTRRYIYWTTTGVRPLIERATMDGHIRQVLIDSDLGSPNQLVVDYRESRIYWTDSILDRIESMDFDGRSRKLVLHKENTHFYGITVFQDYLAWTDRDKRNGIHAAIKHTGEKVRGILHPGIGTGYDLITYDPSLQPLGKGPCDDMNGGCDQLCLPTYPQQRTCSCAIGYRLARNAKSCTSDPVRDNFLLFTDTYLKQVYQMDLVTQRFQAIPLPDHDNPISVDFDPVENKVYWSDVSKAVIKRAFLNGTGEEVVMALANNSIPDGIALDTISRLVYYTDTGNDVIGVISMDGKYMKTLVNDDLDEPRAIVVDNTNGHMYWSDWGYVARIMRADLDGSNRTRFVHVGFGSWPNSLTLDIKGGRIYWCDARRDTIESTNLSGQDRKILLNRPKAHFFGMALMEDHIYYTDWRQKTIMRVNKEDGSEVGAIGAPVFARLNDIHIYKHGTGATARTACSIFNGGCSHFCFSVPSGWRCACPDGVYLRADGFKCDVQGETTNSPRETTPRPKIVTKPPVLTTTPPNETSTSQTRSTSVSTTTTTSKPVAHFNHSAIESGTDGPVPTGDTNVTAMSRKPDIRFPDLSEDNVTGRGRGTNKTTPPPPMESSSVGFHNEKEKDTVIPSTKAKSTTTVMTTTTTTITTTTKRPDTTTTTAKQAPAPTVTKKTSTLPPTTTISPSTYTYSRTSDRPTPTKRLQTSTKFRTTQSTTQKTRKSTTPKKGIHKNIFDTTVKNNISTKENTIVKKTSWRPIRWSRPTFSSTTTRPRHAIFVHSKKPRFTTRQQKVTLGGATKTGVTFWSLRSTTSATLISSQNRNTPPVGLTNYAILGIVLAVVILISVLLLLAVILHRKLGVKDNRSRTEEQYLDNSTYSNWSDHIELPLHVNDVNIGTSGYSSIGTQGTTYTTLNDTTFKNPSAEGFDNPAFQDKDTESTYSTLPVHDRHQGSTFTTFQGISGK